MSGACFFCLCEANEIALPEFLLVLYIRAGSSILSLSDLTFYRLITGRG